MKKLLYIPAMMLAVLVACNKDKDLGPAPRLFRPVIKEALLSEGNWIKASWQAVKGASSYTAQISTDTFKTITASVTLDTNAVLFQNLKWDKLYQVQVKANAADTSHNSGIASLGAIKTARFPTILNIPATSDIADNAVKVSWATSGAAVTGVKILLATDSSVVKDVSLNATDVTNANRVVSGLAASTGYIIYLYSGTTVRGWADFATTAALTGTIIDLREITGVPSILSDTVPDVPSGSIILLKRGETYNISSALNLSKTVTFRPGTDLLNPAQPVIYMPANFNITSGSAIDSIVFYDVTLRGSDYASKYVFNINTACTIGKIRFDNCWAEIFRGVLRTQSQPAIIGTLEMNNCVVDSVAGYGVFNIDVATSRADVIKITNSTIYKAEKVITSKNNSVSVLLENCTINEAPLGNSSNYYIDYSTAGTNNVTNGITINNCIFGIGKYSAGAITVRDVRVNAATTVNASNLYRTADHLSAGNDFPTFTTYTKTAVQLWQNPAAGNFKIIDNTFPGRSTCGDPRWRL